VGACLLASLLLSACYRTTPLPLSAPAPGTRIMAELTPQGSVEMAPTIGSGVHAVEGITAGARQGELDISLLRVIQNGGTGVEWNREVVRFPVTALGSVGERRLDRTRTYAAAGGLTVLAIVLGRIFANSLFEGSGTEEPPPPPPQ
jgi:hypothetical protein